MRRITLGSNPQQRLTKLARVVTCQTENTPKHTRFVSPTRMIEVQAVIAEFLDVNDRTFAVGQLHPESLPRIAYT